eukprot:15073-Heterococcus_DN1.PRE.1
MRSLKPPCLQLTSAVHAAVMIACCCARELDSGSSTDITAPRSCPYAACSIHRQRRQAGSSSTPCVHSAVIIAGCRPSVASCRLSVLTAALQHCSTAGAAATADVIARSKDVTRQAKVTSHCLTAVIAALSGTAPVLAARLQPSWALPHTVRLSAACESSMLMRDAPA